MSLPVAILFDLDDTILSDDIVSEQAWREACRAFDGKVNAASADKLFAHINRVRVAFWSDPLNAGQGWRNLFKSRLTIVKTALKELGFEDEDTARDIVVTYNLKKAKLVKPFPNAERTLKELKKQGIKLALLTNGEAESQRAKVEDTGMSVHFPVCLIEGEIGIGKPDARIFRLALEKLSVTPEQAWMVGDRLEFDILGAQNVGIRSIWCDYTHQGLPPGSRVVPDATIYDISEILDLVTNGKPI